MEGDGEADAGLEDQAHNRQPSNAGIRGNLPEPSAGAGPATPASRAARRWISVVFHILQCQERIGENRSEATRSLAGDGRQQPLRRSWCPALNQLCQGVRRLKEDLKEFHASSLVLLRSCQAECEACVSAVATTAGRTRLDAEALQACQATAARLEQSLQESRARYRAERQRRRLLHNTLVELRGNLRVHCRIRPLLPLDNESGDAVSQSSAVSAEVVRAVDDETVLVKCNRPGHPPINKMYNFDRVYGPAESQSVVFGDVCPLLTSLLDGLISENPPSPEVEVSIVEVYNNDIVDLLAKDSPAVTSGAKREVTAAGDTRKEAAPPTCEAVGSASELLRLVRGGLRRRARLPTLVHRDSSRSHLIVTVTVTTALSPDSTDPPTGAGRRSSVCGPARPPRPPGRAEQASARLQLVDLAGSECAGVSGATGPALRETSWINRSLAALADVLGALSEHRGHVPYRNSRLTHLLQDSIGGDAKFLVLLCVSPSQKHVAQTLQGLGFGTRARQVERGQARRRPRSRTGAV
ncbi:kinesin-like protein KIF25 isoform X2 [Lemur catta]|uniref:kinesin-like protein KIF25 isoform X2 n=1 Tax=Lemur catta TaxID=9447 RepID=UPI001E2683A7|nr:kinesin-like protein KIF25 isoform X2 [Lemur catta]